MDPVNLKTLNAARRGRVAAVLVTDLEDGRDRVVVHGDEVTGDLGHAIDEAFRSGNSKAVEIDGRPFFLNVHVPPIRLVAIGAVHISQRLAPIAVAAGFPLTVVDPRTAFATPERFSGVELLAEWPEEALARQPLDRYTALVALSHDPRIDDEPIRQALDVGCFYVGALGSRKTHAKRLERLAAEGLSPDQTALIHAPIGLDIGAANPGEIAVSIMAEIIACLRQRRENCS
jgi:xanthine dehydrogenase accessory factor